MTRHIRRHVIRARVSAQAAARDGMRLAVLALAVLAIFTHPAGETRLAIVLGLAGIVCSVISRSGFSQARRPVTRQPAQAGPAARTGSPRDAALRTSAQVVHRYSPECMAFACGSCSGIGCDHTCGHPGAAHRSPGNASRPSAPLPADPQF